MKMKMLRHTIVNGKAAAPGAVVDVPKNVAAMLVATGKAQAVKAPAKKSQK